MLLYLFLVNALGFAVMLYDKYLAKNNLWRISETTLFGLAAVGGSIGCICGMYTVRHKTRKLRFVLGMPAILVAQVVAVCLWLYR
jgi:uncharacterized membrane protein YsdA (DUF1294 family)